jgi:hypothetical protein
MVMVIVADLEIPSVAEELSLNCLREPGAVSSLATGLAKPCRGGAMMGAADVATEVVSARPPLLMVAGSEDDNGIATGLRPLIDVIEERLKGIKTVSRDLRRLEGHFEQ